MGIWVIYEREMYGGMILTGETEELGESLSQCHSVHRKSHRTYPGAN